MNQVVSLKDVYFEYFDHDHNPVIAVDNVSLNIEKGEFVVILGHNGSGKSTVAKLINALIEPKQGEVTVFGMNTKDHDKLWDIRKRAGMVFQNPDNQMVATIVEEDIAFGPENLGLPPAEIRKRVDSSLSIVDMREYAKTSPHYLSGGQKQRVAIAGILAMDPDIIIMDEPTAMLDPQGRKEVMNTIEHLNKDRKITIILITHYMDEAVHGDRLVVMDKGKIIKQGTPKEVFRDIELLNQAGITVPQVTELAIRLAENNIPVSKDALSIGELVDELCQLL